MIARVADDEITTVMLDFAIPFAESVSVIATRYEPDAVGVPETVTVAELVPVAVTPVGSASRTQV